jgi:hypothetical protein
MSDDTAFFEYLEARERALDAAAGYFAVANISSAILQEIARSTTNEIISLAARIVLWQRDELREDD